MIGAAVPFGTNTVRMPENTALGSFTFVVVPESTCVLLFSAGCHSRPLLGGSSSDGIPGTHRDNL